MTIKETITSLTKTERQELGKCFSNPIRFAKLLPKYQSLIDEIMGLGLADTLSESVHMILNDMITQPLCKACQKQLVYKPATYTYGDYCDHKCRASFSNGEKDAVIINGVRYQSIRAAVDATGESRFLIKGKLLSPKFPEYTYEKDHQLTCEKHIRNIDKSLLDRKVLEEWKDSKTTLQDFSHSIGKNISTVSLALTYHEIDSSFQQIEDDSVRDFLNTKEDFCAMFDEMSMEAMAKKFGVLDGTIRRYAKKYGLDTSRHGWNRSRGEIELFEFISSLCPDAMSSVRPLRDSKLEADIYISDRKLAFEYNGCYTHSEKFKDKQYHKTKMEMFQEEGIRLIQIWEDDWDTNRNVVKQFITNVLVQSSRIGARKTDVIELPKNEFDSFMNSNHMQGTTGTSIRLGLIYDGKVVAAMGFSKLPKNTKRVCDGEGILLTRFANTIVTGAFTKIISYFKKTYVQYSHITSFADLEIVDQTNNVYTKHGFVETHRVPVDYKYYKKKLVKRQHKFLFRKNRFQQLGMDIDGKTEAELAKEYGLLRCYDSGKIHYVLEFDMQ